MAPSDDYTRDVLARFRDFVGPAAQWQRGLWEVGLVVALREVHEASSAVQAGALSRQAVKWLAQTTKTRLRKDPGAGDAAQVQRLQRLLDQDLTAGSVNHSELALWTDDIENYYLERWQVATGRQNVPGHEQLARALATHLIGQQLSPEFLRDWARTLEDGPTAIDAATLLGEARILASNPPRPFEVMVIFNRPPHKRFSRPAEWRDGRAVSAWLIAAGFSPIRQHGGLVLSLWAPDPYSAARQSGAIVDRLEARAAVGTREVLSLHRESYVSGHARPIAQRAPRRAEVRALEREDALLQLGPGGPVDQSLELLSHLNTSPDAVAAAAGWSSVESLLSGPGDDDKVVTADRLANLVACSWPRAELTTIAWARVKQAATTPDPLAAELKSYETNRERADRVLRAVSDGEDLSLARPAERLALQRMDRLVRSPRQQLMAVQQQAKEALRRLYRQRNLVVHGGQTSGSSLTSALRVAAPLVGAGLDRITHAALVSGQQPLELAARAQLEIERAGTSKAPPLTTMLE